MPRYAVQSLGEVISTVNAQTPQEAEKKINQLLSEEFKRRHAVRVIEVV